MAHADPSSRNDKRAPHHNVETSAIRRLRCLNCGQQIFVTVDEVPPYVCDYCQDMTTWREIEER